jgi:hypothetical protein
MLRRVALVRTDVSEELSDSFIRVTRLGELGTTHPDEGGVKFLRNVGSYKSPHGVTSQKTPFFIVTAVKTSNLTMDMDFTLPSTTSEVGIRDYHGDSYECCPSSGI